MFEIIMFILGHWQLYIDVVPKKTVGESGLIHKFSFSTLISSVNGWCSRNLETVRQLSGFFRL